MVPNTFLTMMVSMMVNTWKADSGTVLTPDQESLLIERWAGSIEALCKVFEIPVPIISKESMG